MASILAPVRRWAHFGQPPTPTQTRLVQDHAHLARQASSQACFVELDAILCGPHVREALQMLLEAGILDILLPEVAATSRMGPESGRSFKDVWEHTKIVVWQSVPRPSVRWAALLHDVGKVLTLRIDAQGKVGFLGHERASYELFCEQTRRRIAFPPSLGERIAELILHHQRPSQYESSWTDAAVRRFAREQGERLHELLLLSRADITSRRPGRRKERLAAISELARRIQSLEAQEAQRPKLPKGLGRALMLALKLPPGPRIGEIRNKIENAVSLGELASAQDMDYYLDYVSNCDWMRE